MKLFYAPGACSLASHIALHEAGLDFDISRIDLKTHRTTTGLDYYAINPKGYVPALLLGDGEMLTENVAILDWIAQQAPALAPQGKLGRTRLIEALAFISTEIHKSFKPFFAGGSEEDKAKASELIGKRLKQIAATMQGDYLFGSAMTVTDAYLFVMTLWSEKMGVPLPASLAAFAQRMRRRSAAQAALQHEGLIPAG